MISCIIVAGHMLLITDGGLLRLPEADSYKITKNAYGHVVFDAGGWTSTRINDVTLEATKQAVRDCTEVRK